MLLALRETGRHHSHQHPGDFCQPPLLPPSDVGRASLCRTPIARLPRPAGTLHDGGSLCLLRSLLFSLHVKQCLARSGLPISVSRRNE